MLAHLLCSSVSSSLARSARAAIASTSGWRFCSSTYQSVLMRICSSSLLRFFFLALVKRRASWVIVSSHFSMNSVGPKCGASAINALSHSLSLMATNSDSMKMSVSILGRLGRCSCSLNCMLKLAPVWSACPLALQNILSCEKTMSHDVESAEGRGART